MTRFTVSPAQIREYLTRDWGLFERSSRDHWRRTLEREGPGALLRATDGVRRYLEAVDPSWPAPESRVRDLEHLIRFKQRIDAASRALEGKTPGDGARRKSPKR